MFTNVLVGVDGKQGGRDAIALAKLLCEHDAAFTLASIYHDEGFAWRGTSPPYEAVELDRCRHLLAGERTLANLDADIRCHGAPTVGRGLHELADSIGADLLVIGSTPNGLLHRVLVSNHTREALNGAPCAVAISPNGFAEQPVALREFGVGYDGSPESEYALSVARTLAAQHGAKLSAFEAITVPTYVAHGRTAVDSTPISELVEQARDRIRALGDVEAHAAYGVAGEELALYGASLDLLVIGSRGYGPLGRLVHGSVANDLAGSARCPLLVLPRHGDTAEAPDEAAENAQTVSPV